MTNATCIRCGTVNLVTDEVCTVCSAELRPVFAQSDEGSHAESDPIPRVYTDDIPPFIGPSDGIGPTFHLFRKNFWLIAKIVFVIFAPFEIFKAVSIHQGVRDWQLALGLLVMQLMCNFLVAPALFYSLLKVVQTGHTPSLNDAYRWSLGKLPKLALASVISWMLTMLGFLLLIIPGIILSLAFAVVYPVAVFEKGSAIDSLRRSLQLTRGRRWNIFGASFVIAILAGVIGLAIAGVANIFILNGITFWPLDAAVAIVGDIFAEALTVQSLVIYVGILRTLESGRSVIE
jgi:uncharacterized membrane protein